MKRYEHFIQEFGDCWDYDNGFFGQLRQGVFNVQLFNKAVDLLQKLSFDDEEQIPKEMVSLLWFIPLFMEWQTERVIKKGFDSYEYAKNRTTIENELTRILGLP